MAEDKTIRISDLAKEIGLSPSRIRQLTDSGVIPFARTEGGHRTFDLAAVKAALARRALAAPERDVTSTLGTPSWQRRLGTLGLAEHEVWRRIEHDLRPQP